ncbi:MAG: ASCH domain-containing protein [Pseudomonadota bacterium]|nr:ASCH domain-containing protein [Pseudomonadota bacterium]
MKVLLSIKPEFVDKILEGTKKFEFRKNCFKRDGVKTVVVYSTMPVGKVVGEFDIEDIISEHPELLWNRTKKAAGISKQFFDEYYLGREKGTAIKVGNVVRYERPLCLSELGDNITAPQSYRYLPV